MTPPRIYFPLIPVLLFLLFSRIAFAGEITTDPTARLRGSWKEDSIHVDFRHRPVPGNEAGLRFILYLFHKGSSRVTALNASPGEPANQEGLIFHTAGAGPDAREPAEFMPTAYLRVLENGRGIYLLPVSFGTADAAGGDALKNRPPGAILEPVGFKGAWPRYSLTFANKSKEPVAVWTGNGNPAAWTSLTFYVRFGDSLRHVLLERGPRRNGRIDLNYKVIGPGLTYTCEIDFSDGTWEGFSQCSGQFSESRKVAHTAVLIDYGRQPKDSLDKFKLLPGRWLFSLSPEE